VLTQDSTIYTKQLSAEQTKHKYEQSKFSIHWWSMANIWTIVEY